MTGGSTLPACPGDKYTAALRKLHAKHTVVAPAPMAPSRRVEMLNAGQEMLVMMLGHATPEIKEACPRSPVVTAFPGSLVDELGSDLTLTCTVCDIQSGEVASEQKIFFMVVNGHLVPTVDVQAIPVLLPYEKRKVSSRDTFGLKVELSGSVSVSTFISVAELTASTRVQQISRPLWHCGRPVATFLAETVVFHGLHNEKLSHTACVVPALPMEGSPAHFMGHRGCGSNKKHSERRVAVAENTILSYLTAHKLGANYVEFDVQRCSDGALVINHDFIIDGRLVSHMSGKEFMDTRSERSGGTRVKRVFSMGDGLFMGKATPVAQAEVHEADSDDDEVPERDGSSTAHPYPVISDNRPGLSDLFRLLPPSLGFNIELKYPCHGPASHGALPPRIQYVNEVLDKVLEMFERYPPRPVIFSTFDPWIVTALLAKQSRWPVFFLTCAEPVDEDSFDWSSPDTLTSDPRAHSTSAGLAFVSAVGADGIVASIETLRRTPSLAAGAKAAGLHLFSYGTRTSETKLIKWQLKKGVSGIIYDGIQ